MTALLPPWPLLAAFMVASLALAITPGPGVIFILTRSAVHGRRAGLASVSGVALGNLASALAAAAGMAVLLGASPAAFRVMRYAGAAWLIYLGWRMLATAPAATAPTDRSMPMSTLQAVRDGFLVATLNPKTLLFFAAFLPQFLAPGADVAKGAAALGVLFVLLALVTDGLYVLLGGSLGQVLAAPRTSRIARRVGGSLLIVMGVLAAVY